MQFIHTRVKSTTGNTKPPILQYWH